MKIKTLLMTGLMAGALAPQSFSQGFHTSLFDPGTDFNHYSVETSPSGDYIYAGTRFGGGNNDIHVIRMDAVGNVLWEQIIDISADDRALDVMVDPADDIIVTGYISPTGTTNSEMYAVKLDPGGGFLADFSLNSFPASAGTNVIFSGATGNYIIGGFYSDPLSVPLGSNEALLVELDPGLNYLNHTEISTTVTQHSSINDIAETPTGYFITGSVGETTTAPERQGVLAVFVNLSLTIQADLSFESTNADHNGVSAVYDAVNDEIQLLSNNSVIHNPQITQIHDVSGVPFIASHYYLNLDPSFGSHNPAGFQLRIAPWDPNILAIAGYFRTYDNGTGSNIHTLPWIVHVDRATGSPISGMYWPGTAPNFHAHGGGVFSTFDGEAPYIFNQEIMTERPDGQGFLLVGARFTSGNFGIDVMTTSFTGLVSCYEPIPYTKVNITAVSLSTSQLTTPVGTVAPGTPLVGHSSGQTAFCDIPYYTPIEGDGSEDSIADENVNTNGTAGSGKLLEVYPNPTESLININVNATEGEGTITLMNALGQTLYTRVVSGNVTVSVDLSTWENGIYLLTYANGETQENFKVIKK